MKHEKKIRSAPIDREEYLKLAQVGDFYRYQGVVLVVVKKTFESVGNNMFEIEVETELVS